MIKTLSTYSKDLLHLFFPHYCEGCGSDIVEQKQLLCLKCITNLPVTNFFEAAQNPVEKIFYGRLKIEAAAAAYYFTKDSLMQHLISQLKYFNNTEIGNYLGRLTGEAMLLSNRFSSIDCIIPLPLNLKKQIKRGYNQAALIANGISAIVNKPVLSNVVGRNLFTLSQTKKDRITRWQTMQHVFEIPDISQLENKHVLLVDDIITTGATLEACGAELLKVPGLKLSIAAVAWTI